MQSAVENIAIRAKIRIWYRVRLTKRPFRLVGLVGVIDSYIF